MHVRNYPEDSVLRRHYEGAAALKRQSWLQRPPEDSVLRRHRAQLVREGSQIGGPSAATAGGAEMRPKPAPSESSMPPQAEAQATGFFGWLGRLFGGSR